MRGGAGRVVVWFLRRGLDSRSFAASINLLVREFNITNRLFVSPIGRAVC